MSNYPLNVPDDLGHLIEKRQQDKASESNYDGPKRRKTDETENRHNRPTQSDDASSE